MDTARAFVLEARRQLIRLIALALTAGAVVVIALMLVLLFVLPDSARLVVYPAMLSLVLAGSSSTLWLLPRIALGQAILPLVLALIGGVIFSAVALRETVLPAVTFLTVVVLLISLGRNRRVTIAVSVVCALLGALLAGTAPRPALAAGELSLGPTLPLVYIASAGALIVVNWLITQRLLDISDHAVGLADERADEAELARAHAMAQARELAEQNEAQQGLLKLVATLETPVVTLADDVVLLPLVGHVDSRRASDMVARLLEAVHRQRVRWVVLEVSGIAIMDSGVAQRILHAVQAVQLLGAQVILCGVRAEMATALVELGVDMGATLIVRTPQEALERFALAHR